MKDIVLGNLGYGDGSQQHPFRPVKLDLVRLIESRMLVQANSGGGKSWLLRRLLEQTHGQVQHLVLDIEGEFHTLREKYDYVLAARSGGDTVASVQTAPLLARRLLELGVSAILDLYELKAWDRIQFVKLFLEALIDAPRALWHPVLVVVDEAHHFCPEKGSAESASAVVDLMTRGRKRGFCGVLATQRLSKLKKDAAAEANVKLIGRASLDVDMARAAEEIGFTSKADMARLRTLPAGSFFGFGPGLSDRVIELRVGPVETTHPRPGQRAVPVPAPRKEVQKVLDQLKDLPKEAETELRTAAELRAEVARLKREIAAGPAPAPAAAPRRVEVQVVEPVLVKRLEVAASAIETLMNRTAPFRDELREGAEKIAAAIRAAQALNGGGAHGELTTTAAPHDRAGRPAPIVAPKSLERDHRPAPSSDGLSGPEQRILDALAWLEGVGQTQPTNGAAAFLAGYVHTGGGYCNPRGSLRVKGLVAYHGSDRLSLTGEGRRLADHPQEALTPAAMHARVLARIGGPEQRILTPLLKVYPEGLTNEALAAQAGYEPKGGGYCNPRGRLRSLGLVRYENDSVYAMPMLFLGGA